jgi:hypothetical protein
MFEWLRKKKGPTIEERMEQLAKSNQEIQSLVTNVAAEKQALEAENKNIKEELKILREQTAANASKKDSNEPWIDIMSEGVDPVRGIVIGLDWNDAMIQYLKENGITGTSDEDAIRKYIAYLYEDLVQKLEFKVQQQASHKGKITDFE